jgi:hypothetical protein
MMENFQQFLSGMSASFQDESLSIEAKITKVVNAYIDFLFEFPDLPLFVLNELKGDPSTLAARLSEEIAPARQQFFQQLTVAKEKGMVELDAFQFVANLIGLTVFPFVGRPLLQRVTNVNDEQFIAYMNERRKLVPKWLMMMMTK